MRVAVIGGGPAGLYFALLLRKSRPETAITVVERNRPDDTFGWGVVFSDQTLGNFRAADPDTCEQIESSFAHWDDIDVHVHGRVITSSGHGFAGIARKKLLHILQERASELGVTLRFQTEVADERDLSRLGLTDLDLIVAADGVNSSIRAWHAPEFLPDVDVRSARYIWLGTTFPFDAFTFYVVENEHGVFQAHCYRFDESTSTFIVECDERSWRNAGFDRLNLTETIAACEQMFGQWLAGHRLMSNARHTSAPWSRFMRVRNQSWFHDNIVLIGDAAHTAHFSIGSGTKLAMEDAIALAREVAADRLLPQALAAYQDERMTEALRLQNAARNSMEWFEQVRRYISLDPEQFAYSLLTRSQRVSHENLRLRDPRYLTGVERWFAAASAALQGEAKASPYADTNPPPPMFTPFTLRGMTLVNRVVVAPMDMYSAVDGTPTDFHLVHLGNRALGGAGLIITEMTCVSPEARITLGCTGMYTPAHITAWRRIVDFVHSESAAKICLQLGHSGSKGSTRVPWEGTDVPLEDEGWNVMGPSAVRYAPALGVPRPMDRADMDRVRGDFVAATRMGIEAGFDMLELHCAHGYLLSSFITPLSNKRTDDYGGALENRVRYPVEVFRAMRTVWPAERPMSVRISATDWVAEGVTGDDAVKIARAFMAAGADIIHVSTGQTSIDAQPVYGRMYQTPFSDQVRNEARIPTIAVGNITEADQVNGIIAAGRADLCALARPHLVDPFWTLHAAAELGYAAQHWPRQVPDRPAPARTQPGKKGGFVVSAFAAPGIEGHHAVVTGGGRGIGAAIAETLAAHGAYVTLIGRTASGLQEMAQSLADTFNASAHTAACDVTNPDDVIRAFASAVSRFGDVQILINNAGQADAGPFRGISLETWNRLIAVNMTGTFLCMQQVLPAMVAAGSGRIVNIASTAGLKGYSRIAAYCAAKHGVVGLTRAVAAETARTGVTVNAVCPGYTEDTDMFAMAVDNVMRSKGVPANEARTLLARHSPRGTFITPAEVADTVLWLCSPGASAITGQAIAAAGGEVV